MNLAAAYLGLGFGIGVFGGCAQLKAVSATGQLAQGLTDAIAIEQNSKELCGMLAAAEATTMALCDEQRLTIEAWISALGLLANYGGALKGLADAKDVAPSDDIESILHSARRMGATVPEKLDGPISKVLSALTALLTREIRRQELQAAVTSLDPHLTAFNEAFQGHVKTLLDQAEQLEDSAREGLTRSVGQCTIDDTGPGFCVHESLADRVERVRICSWATELRSGLEAAAKQVDALTKAHRILEQQLARPSYDDKEAYQEIFSSVSRAVKGEEK